MRQTAVILSLLVFLIPFEGEAIPSLTGSWRTEEGPFRQFTLREQGSFSLYTSVPSTSSTFTIEFTLIPGESRLFFWSSDNPEVHGPHITETNPVYSISAPLQDLEMVMSGTWEQNETSLLLIVHQVEWSRINNREVGPYVRERVDDYMMDKELSEAEQQELDRLRHTLTDTLHVSFVGEGERLLWSYTLEGDQLTTIDEYGEIMGKWRRERVDTLVLPISWAHMKRQPR